MAEQGQVKSSAHGCAALAILLTLAVAYCGGRSAANDQKQPAQAATTADVAEPTSAAPPALAAATGTNVNDEPLVRKLTALSEASGGTGDGLAAIINLNGKLCAKSQTAEPMARKHHYSVVCTEVAGNPSMVRYDLDAKRGKVKLLDRLRLR